MMGAREQTFLPSSLQLEPPRMCVCVCVARDARRPGAASYAGDCASPVHFDSQIRKDLRRQRRRPVRDRRVSRPRRPRENPSLLCNGKERPFIRAQDMKLTETRECVEI